ncbi:MAG: TIGR02757 family protein [Bacteroidales bacterium]|nr:TIGR02757 family protein [Bacteroidales bacterium]
MKMISKNEIYKLLEKNYNKYNSPSFIESDPVSIPHKFSKKEDIEIAGFIAATIAWGQRKSIIKNANRIVELMHDSPYDFLMNAKQKDFEKFNCCVHRTFNGADCIYFLKSLQNVYLNHGGIENCFNEALKKENDLRFAISYFRKIFFELQHSKRTEKHFSNPDKKSTTKKINMFLRWMVRNDARGVDFGIWKKIKPSQLYIPLDVHVANTSRKLDLLKRKQNDWQAVVELTNKLKEFDADDPVKYDFALFGLGVNEI